MVIRGEIVRREGEERARMEEEERLDEEFNSQFFVQPASTQRTTLASLKPMGKKAPVIRLPERGACLPQCNVANSE